MTHLDPLGSPARWVQVDDRQAITRSDTNAVLGIFSTGYVMHQYATWLLSTVANILDDDLVISSAGLLRGGAIAWVEVSVPETITTPVGFDFRPNLLATTSFDGSISTTFKRTVTATVCDNTMDLALAEKGQHYKVKHTRYSSSKITAAREALAVVHTLGDDFAKELRSSPTPPSANPSGGPSWTRTSPSTTARVTPSKAALGRWRPGSAASWRTSTGTTGGPLRGPAPPGCSSATNTWAHHNATVRRATRAERNLANAVNGTTTTDDRLALAQLMALVSAA